MKMEIKCVISLGLQSTKTSLARFNLWKIWLQTNSARRSSKVSIVQWSMPKLQSVFTDSTRKSGRTISSRNPRKMPKSKISRKFRTLKQWTPFWEIRKQPQMPKKWARNALKRAIKESKKRLAISKSQKLSGETLTNQLFVTLLFETLQNLVLLRRSFKR